MLVTIESIDPSEERRLGYMQLPSFFVKFTSSIVSGSAWLVPASGNRRGLVGQSFRVEINQESISAFEVVGRGEMQNYAVLALPEHACFQVYGIINSVETINEPENEQMITIKAGEAYFHTTKTASGIASISKGQTVAFRVHDMSLWDEAI